MKKVIYTLLCILLAMPLLHAQKERNWWYFGLNAGMNFNQIKTVNGVDLPTPVAGPINTYEGCFVASDNQGNLLMSSNGVTVYNKNNTVMQNGTGLLGNDSSTQSGIAVQAPENPDKYYIITVAAGGFLSNGICYSVVDMSANAGLGKVTDKNIVLKSGAVDENIAIVAHTNGKDYWLVHRTISGGVCTFYVWILTKDGFTQKTSYVMPDTVAGTKHEVGGLKFSSDGTKLINADFFNYSIISGDFNPSTGQVSNAKETFNIPKDYYPYMAEFSPSGEYVYIGMTGGLFSYKIKYSDMRSGNTYQATALNTGNNIAACNFQTGPDKRIYGISMGNNHPLTVIMDPDNGGNDIRVFNNYFLSGTQPNLGLPAFAPFCSKPTIDITEETIASGQSYTWSVDGKIYNTSGIYKVTNNLCTADQELHLTVTPVPPVTTGVSICIGESGSLTATNASPSKSVTTFSGHWNVATDPKALSPDSSDSSCHFQTRQNAGYTKTSFTVSLSGNYKFKMTDTNDYDGAAYIYTGNFVPGNCSGGGTWITGDDDSDGNKMEPNMTAYLKAGTVYTLISTMFGSVSMNADYTWTITPPAGGQFILDTLNYWYTTSTGGYPIGWGDTFNPVGVTGSGLFNTYTAGTTIYYVSDGNTGSPRTPASFIIKKESTFSKASSSPTLCINTALTNITHTTTDATGIGTATGLPKGVTAAWAANTITISGTPTLSGTFYYSIPLTGGCGIANATGTITVDPINVANTASATRTSCLDIALSDITLTTIGATGIGTATGLPIGVTASWAANTITINGTPTVPGIYNYSIPLTGGCGTAYATGTITVNKDTTISTASETPTVCIYTALPNITHTTTVVNGIGTATGLPNGVTAIWDANTITISGTPTVAGTFNYSIPLLGSCGIVSSATGTITVTRDSAVSIASDTPIVCINTALTDITHATTGATGIGTTTGLPTGVSASWATNRITISGTPTVAGTFNYSIPLTGSCGTALNATGKITVTKDNTVSVASDTPILCINKTLTDITHTTTGATGIGNATGLPTGVKAVWTADTITISGTPTVAGNFNYSIPLTGGCGNINATGTITVNKDNTVSNASATPTLCINTALTNITHTTTGATEIGTATGLPNGVTATWTSNTITISGTPTVAGTFAYTIPLTGGCGTVLNATGTITVNKDNTVGIASATPTLCINTALTNITHTTTGATAIGTATGLPTGVTAVWAANTITISGTPTVAGTFNYSIPLTGGCGTANATGTITVNKDNTVSNASATPTLCINTALTNITHTTTGATGIGTATGLSTGVTAAWAADTITISGTPTVAGTFNYSIPLTGGCGTANATGTITVNKDNTVSTASATPTLCINTALTNITHTTTGATGIGTATGLPTGVTAAWTSNTITISGTPTVAGTFNYSIPLTGGCGTVLNATGTITVNKDNTVSNASATPTLCINTALTNITHTTTGATGIGTATGLPNGVTAAWAANTITISGTPTVAGTFNYSIPLTGGCGTVLNATGTITVNKDNTVSNASATPTLCINTALTNITHTTTGATEIGTATGLPTGVTAAWASNTITISGTPTVAGTFNYSIPLTGGCGTVLNATGTITINKNNTVSIASATPTVCINTALTNITHTTTGATGIGTATGLPTGVTAVWAADTITISGTPTEAGTFDYSIPLNGGCGNLNATGSITVTPKPTKVITTAIISFGDIYSWAVNATDYNTSGTYLITNNGCTADQELQLTVSPKTADITTKGASICIGDSGSLAVTNTSPAKAVTKFTGHWNTATDPRTNNLQPNVTQIGCAFYSRDQTGYTKTNFTVSSTGTYKLKMANNTAYIAAAYIYTGDFLPGYCTQGKWIVGDNDGTKQPVLNAYLEAGTIYTLVSTLDFGISMNADYTWTITPPSGGQFLLETLNYWYTTLTGGFPIGWGDTFNPVGVTGSGLSDTNTAGTTTYYVSDGNSNSKRIPTDFVIKPNNTASVASATPTLCINTVLTNITHTTTDATGIGTATGLPTGITAVWAANTITISGTPTVTGVFNYSIPLTGGCGNLNATGTITVNADNTVSVASATPTLFVDTALTNITHTTTGANAIGTATELPAGVTAAWAANTITISGTPTVAGVFNYSIPLTGGCGNLNATGKITVKDNVVIPVCDGEMQTILKDDFGSGTAARGPKPDTSDFYTTYTFSTSGSIGSNSYALLKTASQGNGSWSNGGDHTTGNGGDGYMLAFDANTTVGSVFYEKNYTDLCAGSLCTFSIYAANIVSSFYPGFSVKPMVKIELINPDTDAVLQSTVSNELALSSQNDILWNELSMSFTIPVGLNAVKVRVSNAQSDTNTAGNDITFDDVSFSICVPLLTTSGSDKKVCYGESASLVAVNPNTTIPYSYQWQKFDGTDWNDITGAVSLKYATPTLSQTTKYRIRYAQTGIDITNNQNLKCSGGKEVEVEVTPKPTKIITTQTICSGETYNWSANNTDYTAAGTYNVTNNGCTADEELQLTVTPKPTKIITTKTICSGQTYNWSLNNTDYTTSGTYTVTNNGCTANQELQLTVTPKPAKIITTKTICSGQSYNWSVNNTDYTTSGTYTVTNNGCTADQELQLTIAPKPTKNITTKTICFGETYNWSANNTDYTTPGTYNVTNNGCTADEELQLTVTPKPTKIITTQRICSGETYNWSANNNDYKIAGTYIVTNNGCTADQELQLTVTPKPTKIITTQTICSGETYNWSINNTDYKIAGIYTVTNNGCTADQELQLTVTPKPAKIITTQMICSGETYNWSINNTSYTTTGTYTVANNGCTADQELQLTVTPKPAKIITTKTICSGQTYNWSVNNTNYTTAGTYTVTNNGCTADQELQLTVSPKPAKIITSIAICSGETYNWSLNNTNYTTAGTYTITNNGCTADQELQLTVSPKPAKIITPIAICSGETYNWSVNNVDYTIAGTYTVTNIGCMADQELILKVAPALNAFVVPNSILPEICANDKNGQFTIEITGGTAPYKVALDDRNGNYAPFSSTTIRFDNLSGGNHNVYIKDALNCTFELEVPMPDAVLLNPIAVIDVDCVNNLPSNLVTVKINKSITNPSDVDYSLDGDPLGYQNSNVFTNIAPGTHFIRARHSNTCEKDTREFTVEAVDPLVLNLADGGLNEIIATAKGGDGDYRYAFEGDSFSTNNKLIIYKSGDYTVTVTDKKGCTTTVTKYFTYIDVCIPNYFTPNGDGINDDWAPGCTAIYKHLTFTIFDRNGRILGNYKLGQKWDGKYNGTELPSGDYWYVLKLNDNNDNREFTGHFNLYR